VRKRAAGFPYGVAIERGSRWRRRLRKAYRAHFPLKSDAARGNRPQRLALARALRFNNILASLEGFRFRSSFPNEPT
jgi:hypothetical protein